MATATAAPASPTVDPDRTPPLRLDSIPTIDLRLFSQSELYSLSMSSNSSFELNRCDDVVIPQINRSVFNESAGSRKQTYSRLRLAPAGSSPSTKTTIHHRTPHLRSPHARTSNSVNDPEQVENYQIIRMLKGLFKPDPNFEGLVPIEVETDTNIVMPESSNPEIKRKRGRPRKQENAVFIRSPAAKRMRNDTVKKVVVFDNDRDREIINCRGMEVNIMNLGRLEDPYGPEIRRRTEGMSTEDDLLGFLRGLNGQWGTKSEKKRVVDASDFGDALPKGWMLGLSIKKRGGRVWLFCRRYISPSGHQFESCKEASMYLLSLVGQENLHKPSDTQSNDRDDFALNGDSENAAGLFGGEDLKSNSAVPNPIAPSTTTPTDCEQQVKSEILDHLDLQIAHKTENAQLGSTISEQTAVKGGIFECQFCDKTFNEKNQYNGHITTHATNENESSVAAEAPAAENVDPVLDIRVSDRELPVMVSAENNAVMETHDACFDDKSTSASPENDRKISSITESAVNKPVSTIEEPQMTLVSFQIKSNARNASSNKLDDFQILRNNQLISNEVASLHSSQDGLNTGDMAYNTGITLEFGFQDDVSGLYENAQESSERGLFDDFCIAETSDDIFSNKIYSTPLESDGVQELSLTFGNPHSLYAAADLEQKKDSVHCAVGPSKIEDAFVCAWCRNEVTSQAEVGSLCPSCSASFSGQINIM